MKKVSIEAATEASDVNRQRKECKACMNLGCFARYPVIIPHLQEESVRTDIIPAGTDCGKSTIGGIEK